MNDQLPDPECDRLLRRAGKLMVVATVLVSWWWLACQIVENSHG